MKQTTKTLIIEKANYCRYYCSEIVRLDNFQYQNTPTLEAALQICEQETFDVVILNADIDFRGALADCVGKIHLLQENVPIVIAAEAKDAEKTIECMKCGAVGVIFKPFTNIAKIEGEILNAVKSVALPANTVSPLTSTDNVPYEMLERCHGIVGKSMYLKQLWEIIQRIAPIDVNMLIIGESGTGKEMVAKMVHLLSHRAKNKFVAVNCGALPEGLVESSFFGSERGAFTGADKTRQGYFGEAEGGTLFLDEISNMTERGQMALLRVLQELEYTRVGGTKSIKVNTRIVASTNKNLRIAAERGSFREDLYYRLNVVTIKTIPLRERREDISVLATYFVDSFCSKYDIPRKSITPQAMAIMEAYAWPGNIRELRHFVEGLVAVIPSGKRITSRDVEEIINRTDESIQQGSGMLDELLSLTYDEAKEWFERYYFSGLLERNQDNAAHTARLAGIHPATLHRKINQLRLRPQTAGPRYRRGVLAVSKR